MPREKCMEEKTTVPQGPGKPDRSGSISEERERSLGGKWGQHGERTPGAPSYESKGPQVVIGLVREG